MAVKKRKTGWVVHFLRPRPYRQKRVNVRTISKEGARNFGEFLTRKRKDLKDFRVTQVRRA